MAKIVGPLDVDYRVRAVAVVPEMRVGDYYTPPHQKVFYGLDAKTLEGIQEVVYDLTDTYRDLSVGGRKSVSERETQKHFFNKRIIFDGETIQGHHYSTGFGTYNKIGGEKVVGKTETGEGSAGCGDRDAIENKGKDIGE